jgi:hypothetical protein
VGLGELVQLAAEPDDGPSPQLGCVGVPHNRRAVVVAIGAQRAAQAGVGFLVPLAAGQPPAVWAVVRLAPWPAACDPAAVGGGAAGSQALVTACCWQPGQHYRVPVAPS